MFLKKMGLMIRALLVVFSFSLLSIGEDAEARAGGKRSFGQRSQPTAQPRSPNPPPAQQQVQPASNRGSFMKGLAGGLAGGLIGSMLFWRRFTCILQVPASAYWLSLIAGWTNLAYVLAIIDGEVR